MVSAPTPNSFIHVSHVGINRQGNVEASPGIDPSWKNVLSGLQSYSGDGEATHERIDFSSGFWKSVETIGKTNNSETTLTNPSGDDSKSYYIFLWLALILLKVTVKPKMRRRMPTPSFTTF